MARRDIPKLTIETITNLYLYGELIKPTPLEMTDVKLIRGPEKPPGELGYTQVYSDVSIFMSTGAGRFANGYQSPLFSAFMSGSTPPEYVPGQRNVFSVDRMNALYSPKVTNIPGSFAIQQWAYADGVDDFAERVHVFNSSPFRIVGDFVIDADGTRYIENYAILPNREGKIGTELF